MDTGHIARLVSQGGYLIYALIACSIVTVAIIIDRTAALAVARPENIMREEFARARPGLSPADQPAWLEATACRLVNRLRHRLDYLDTIITLAPLLGLLGTVIGMIRAFSLLNIQTGQPLAITGGVGEALISTAAGLAVAIVALVGQSLLNQRIRQIVNRLEDEANRLLFGGGR
ncbi:MAG: MotA/TolQ/ExbB proton channel family protein [Negativicutes bacterium]|nr:MotA/TolQ/ExbB proton channel family protein [Negativicutes bacterium]